MKIYGLPEDVKAPEYDYSTYDAAAIKKEDLRFYTDLKASLKAMGYIGECTGKCLYLPQGDGKAVYMVAHAKKNTCLIHCPVGDAWHVPEYVTRGLRKAEVLKRSFDPLDPEDTLWKRLKNS